MVSFHQECAKVSGTIEMYTGTIEMYQMWVSWYNFIQSKISSELSSSYGKLLNPTEARMPKWSRVLWQQWRISRAVDSNLVVSLYRCFKIYPRSIPSRPESSQSNNTEPGRWEEARIGLRWVAKQLTAGNQEHRQEASLSWEPFHSNK